MERVRAPGRARGRRRHQQARGLGTYKGTGNRNPFHIISGLDGRSRGTRKELVSISTVAAPDFVADAPGLPRKAPVILMERFAGLTPERFYDREFGIGIIRQKCKVRFERVAADAARSLDLPEGLEMLRTDRVSYDITKEPVEYRINRGRIERTLVSFDVVI